MYYEFPRDFPESLERIKEEADLTWNGLGPPPRGEPLTAEGVARGTVPDSTNLFILLTLAEKLGIRKTLMDQKKMCRKTKVEAVDQRQALLPIPRCLIEKCYRKISP